MALRTNERWLSRVWFLKQAEALYLTRLAMEVQAMVFAPSELCPNGFLYVVHRGVAMCVPSCVPSCS